MDTQTTTDAPKVARIEITVPSASNPTTTYTVVVTSEGVSCDCPAWRFQQVDPAERSCKHTRTVKIVRDNGESADERLSKKRFGDLTEGDIIVIPDGEMCAGEWRVTGEVHPSMFGGQWGRLAIDTFNCVLETTSMTFSADGPDDLVTVVFQ